VDVWRIVGGYQVGEFLCDVFLVMDMLLRGDTLVGDLSRVVEL
jgi:hypothetical protein